MENKWYVIRVRPRHEKTVADRLSEKYDVYLPLVSKISQWSDRKKVIETPLFSGYVFIKTTINNKFYILAEQGVSSFVQFGNGPASLRDKDIESIKLMLLDAETLKVEEGYKLAKGQKVRITRGAFAGIEGVVLQMKKRSRLYLSIEQLGKIISVEIDLESIELI